jgi:hypothetical protein
MKFLILAVVLFAYANAHTCMIYPKQRGYIDSAAYTTPASTVCNHEEPGPCGGMIQEIPKVSFVPGERTLVTFQKNYDHYYPDYPVTQSGISANVAL